MATNKTRFRAPSPWVIKEEANITDFANWQSNLNYYIGENDDYAPYLEATWSKASVRNRGFTDDATGVENRKTAVQKKLIVDQMLGIVAQYSPSLLRNDILKKCTNLSDVWTHVRRYYSFQQSETNFLKISKIKRKEGERYQTLYQRIIAHLEDNLITIESGIMHDGEEPTEDEILSPTAERLAVYLWMCLIDVRLPDYVSRVYANDLQSKSLKDIQPQIVDNMESLLAEINTHEDIQINYSRSSNPKSYSNDKQVRFKSSFGSKNKFTNKNNDGILKSKKECILCKAL